MCSGEGADFSKCEHLGNCLIFLHCLEKGIPNERVLRNSFDVVVMKTAVGETSTLILMDEKGLETPSFLNT